MLRRPRRVSGIYLWGAVGRGKSFIMDEFYRVAPGARKRGSTSIASCRGYIIGFANCRARPSP